MVVGVQGSVSTCRHNNHRQWHTLKKTTVCSLASSFAVTQTEEALSDEKHILYCTIGVREVSDFICIQ